MLALSKRTIMSEKVDILLKIGLGPFGKVSALDILVNQPLTLIRPTLLLHGTPALLYSV